VHHFQVPSLSKTCCLIRLDFSVPCDDLPPVERGTLEVIVELNYLDGGCLKAADVMVAASDEVSDTKGKGFGVVYGDDRCYGN
jgi:hypothetical protein